MAKVAAFRSKKTTGIYHTCSKCTEGNNIERKNKTKGTGGGRLCNTCKRLTKQRKC